METKQQKIGYDFTDYMYEFINKYVYNYIDRENGRKTRKNIAGFLEKIIDNIPLSKKSIGVTLRSIHVMGPFIMITLLILSRFKLVCDIIMGVLILIPVLFILLDGCVLSSLELLITKDNFTVVDPLLEWNNMEINTYNRVKMNYYVCFIYFIMGCFIYTYRFYL
jgi:hypothetical protein